jgi:hypothetical protein
MPDSPFSQEALRHTLETLPPDQGGIGVVVKSGDVGIAGAVNKPLGKGWTIAATGQWMKQTGYAVGAWLGWTGSSKT